MRDFIPFTEDMLNDPRGVLILCQSLEDAEDLEQIIKAHGVWWDLPIRYSNFKADSPDKEVCFRFKQEPYISDAYDFGYGSLDYYESEPEFDGFIWSVFVSPDNDIEISEGQFEEILRGEPQ